MPRPPRLLVPRLLVPRLLVTTVALSACAAGGAMQGAQAVAAAPTVGAAAAPADASATPALPEQVVVEGALTVEVTDVGDVVPALRAQVEAVGGRIVHEESSGAATSWRAQVKLRLPPDQLEPIAAWLAGHGRIVDKRVTGTDVSRTLFDQDLALANLETTSARLTQLLAQGGLAMADILAVEQELTRIRGEIERIKGEHRYLADRVALATIDVALYRADGAVRVASAKAYPGLRFAALSLLDPDGRRRTRLGGGLVLHTELRTASFELDVFGPADDGAGGPSRRAAIATLGGAGYSDFLGRGRRRFGNPYLGLRMGYAYVDSSRFAIQGEAGLELWKHAHALIDVNVRATGLIGSRTDLALVSGASAVIAF